MTGAIMTVINQMPSPITLGISNVECMYENDEDGSNLNLFNGAIVDPRSQLEYYIEDCDKLLCWFQQSQFTISYSESTNFSGSAVIYMGEFSSTVQSNTSSATQGIALLTNYSNGGATYNFYFYYGPGIVNLLLNSLVQANAMALTNAIQYATDPFIISLQGNSYISASEIQLTDITNLIQIFSPYATMTPMGGNIVNITVIANWNSSVISALFTGMLLDTNTAYNNLPISITIEGLQLLLEGTVDLSVPATVNSQSPVNITTVQCLVSVFKVDGIDVSISLPELLQYFNDTYNSQILDNINSVINGSVQGLLTSLNIPFNQ